MNALVPDDVERFRAQYRETQIGPNYRGWAHFAFTSCASFAVIAFAISRVHRVVPLEWLTIPTAFLIANAAEYFGHKGAMHRPRKGLGLLYRRHTREHHHFFTNDAMAYESSRDFKMVLFPPVMLFFFLGAIATPIGLLLFLIASANVAWLYVAVAMSYFLTYEWFHFSYHLSEGSLLGRNPIARVLRHHHQTHHDKSLMGKYNFNITFPFATRSSGPLTLSSRSLQVTLSLQREELRIAPLLFDQRCVRPFFDDLPALDHQDAIGHFHGRKAMRDHDARLAW